MVIMSEKLTYEELKRHVEEQEEEFEDNQPKLLKKFVPKRIRRFFIRKPGLDLKSVRKRRKVNQELYTDVCERSSRLVDTVQLELESNSDVGNKFPADTLECRTEVADLLSEVEDLQSTGRREYLREEEQEYLETVRESLCECQANIQEAIQDNYTTVRNQAQDLLEALETETEDARTEGATLSPETASRQADLADLRSSIVTLQDVSQRDDFEAEESKHLEELHDSAAEYQQFLETKTAFDNRIGDLEQQLAKVEERVEPYREFDGYLQTADKQELTSALEEIETQISAFRDEYQFEVLAESNQMRLSEVRTAVEQLIKYLLNYNEKYAQEEFDSVAPDASETLDEIETSLAPTRNSGAALPDDADAIQERLQETLDELDRLLEDPLGSHLSQDAQSTLTAFRERAVEYQKVLKTKPAFDDHIDDWEQQLANVEPRVEPYLDFDAYLGESDKQDIISSLDELGQQIHDFRQDYQVDVLSDPDRERIDYVDKRGGRIREHLEGYNDRYVEREFEAVAADVTDAVGDIEASLRPARTMGASLPNDIETIEDRIQANHEEIDRLFGDPLADHLTSDHRETLTDLRETLSELNAFIEAKATFEAEITLCERSVSELEESAAPYLTYDRYLTRPARTDLEEAINRTREDLTSFQESLDLSLLAKADQERLDGLRTRWQSVKSHLDGYNEAFVAKQRNRHADLFTDIDEQGNDLTPAQQEAVIRNGIYNQVVAAAGTGKTLALIYRIAYLVLCQDVSPSRILACTYTGKAAEEMETRLREQFGITSVEIDTLHSVAKNEIVLDHADENLNVVNSNDVYNLIEDVIREETQRPDSEFNDHYVEFLYHYKDDYLDEADFEERADYIAERAEKTYETLAGETVASRAEKVIADFLFRHDVKYQYEVVAEWADGSADKDVYRPDFYLPEYDIHIEHWGLDERGEVAPWFSWTTEEYLDKLTWARDQFETNDPILVETYDFEHEAGHLERALAHRLERHGVELEQMGFEDLVDSTFEYLKKEQHIKESFKQFIENAKTFDIAADEIEARLTKANPRQYHFGRCGEIMLRRYNDFLARNNQIDFNDMIYDAISAIDAAPKKYRSQYDHLLIDEFQDISLSQLRLIQKLTGSEDGIRLFCVGDDWQSIYSFQGAQVEYFVDFEDYFEAPVRTVLTANYRCPETIIDAGNELISQNEDQIDKTVHAERFEDTTPLLHTVDGHDDRAYERRIGTYTAELIDRLLADGVDPGDVMVLCRYDDAVPFLDKVKRELRNRSIPYDGGDDHDVYRPPEMDIHGYSGGIDVFSVHQAKGREADHVILLHAVEGKFGFPAADRDEELIEPVRTVEPNSLEEERRLFYVAMTRAKKQLHIQTRGDSVSPFVGEIEEYLKEERSIAAPGEAGETTTLTAKVKLLWEDTPDSQQQAGVLEDPTDSKKFVSWKNEVPHRVEEGVWYRFEKLRVSEYKGEKEFVIGSGTNVIRLMDEASPAERSE